MAPPKVTLAAIRSVASRDLVRWVGDLRPVVIRFIYDIYGEYMVYICLYMSIYVYICLYMDDLWMIYG